MISGQPPINHEIGSETIEVIAKRDLPSLSSVAPETPPWLIRLVDWLHRPQRQDRPESAEMVGDLLEQCLAHLRQPEAQPLPKCLTENARTKGRKYFAPMVAAVCLPIAALAIPLAISISVPRSSVSNPALPSAPQVASEVASPDGSGSGDVIDSSKTNVAGGQSEASTEWQLPEALLSDLSREAISIESQIASPWGMQPINTSPVNSDPTSPKEIE
jgi:hypothetical protein